MNTTMESTSMFQKTDKVNIRIFNSCPECGKKWETSIEIAKEFCDMMNWSATMTQSIFCEVCKQKQEETELIERRKRQIMRQYEIACIPAEFQSWDRDKGNIDLCRWIKENSSNNLIISGDYGTGKSRSICVNLCNMLKNAVSNEYVLNVLYYRFPDLANDYAGICKEDISHAKNYLKTVCNQDILVIDDLGKKRITENGGELLYEIIDMLYNGSIKCRLWITANIDWRKLAIHFANRDVGNAVVSRIDRMISDGRMIDKQN